MPTENSTGRPRGEAAAAAVRAAIQLGMEQDEPLIRPGMIGGALTEARRIRHRRRLAGVAALAAIVPAIAIGVSVVQLGPGGGQAMGTAGRVLPAGSGQAMGAAGRVLPADAGRTGRGLVMSEAPGQTRVVANPSPVGVLAPPSVRVVRVSGYRFVRPVLRTAQPVADPVPITAQSLGQLLIDELPPGARYTPVMATVGSPPSQGRLSLATFDQVTTAHGTGSVSVQLIHAAAPGSAFTCGIVASDESCTSYRLRAGVEVNETAITSWESGAAMLAVTVFRPGTGLVSIEEDTASVGAVPVDTLPPLALAQLVRAALDPRWRFTVTKAFAARASGLRVAPANRA